MMYVLRVLAASAVGVLGAAGPALAEPPDDWAPNPPSPPVVTMSTPEVVEGTGGDNAMVFTFTLDEPAQGGESFRFYTQDAQGSAMPIEDHEPMLEFPVFGAGDTELTVEIPLVTDSVPEANEHILVTMDHPEGLTIAGGAVDGTGVIIDDDIPTLAIDDVTLAEGTGGPTGFHFTVELSEPSTVDVFVSATPVAGTAVEGDDWQGLPQLVEFDPGETEQEFVVSVVGDSTPESDEKFTVELSDADYATIADAVGRGTIVNDDARKKTSPDTRPGVDSSPTSPSANDSATVAPTTTTTTSVAALDAELATSGRDDTSDARLNAAAVFIVLGILATLAAGAAWRGHGSSTTRSS